MSGSLAMKLLWRDGRSGELTLLVLALLLAVTSSTTISLFADRLQRTMNLQAAEFLAGDLAVTGSAPADEAWLSAAGDFGLRQAQTVEFASMLLEHGQMLLVSVKAAGSNYPLRGELKAAEGDAAAELSLRAGPVPGEAWVERRVLSALALRIGDPLIVGEKTLTVSHVLHYEPDKRGDFYSFAPRVMINLGDLPATGAIQPGSHVNYGYQFVGDESALAAFKAVLRPQLKPSQRIMDIHDDRPELGGALQRAERYLGLSSIVVIVIAGVAIAMAAGRYSERHFNAVALLRCLGCRQRRVVWLYSLQFLVLGALTCAVGCLLGWVGQEGLFYWLRPLLPEQVASPGITGVLLGFATGMAILLGFALPPLLRLRRVSPLRVIRRELTPVPVGGWLIYGLAIALVSGLIWRYSSDGAMTAVIVLGGLLSVMVLALLLHGLLVLVQRWLLPRLGLTWRIGLQGLLRSRAASVGQILAFAVTLAAMVLSFNVRNDLISDWRRQLPERAPNHFALNIFPERVAEFQHDLIDAGIDGSPFYPVVKGRLIEVNGEPVRQRVSKDSQGDAATQRELSLTWSEQLPEDNRITSGRPWAAGQPGLVSVEQKLAENLNIRVGDRLLFTVGSTQLTATVASLRSLRWETMKPNFYMIFSPGTLDSLPTTYLTSFYLPGEYKDRLHALLKKYPATTVLEVDQIIRQFKTLLDQLTQAVDLLLYFALAAGFTVLFAAVYATLDNRIYQATLMRTLGAQRRRLRNIQLIEFAAIGGLAGILGVILSQGLLFLLYNRIMPGEFHPAPWLWLEMPAVGAVAVGLAGLWGVRGVAAQSPMRVLRRW